MRDFFFNQKMSRFSVSFLLVAAIAVLAGCTNNSSGGSSTPTTPGTPAPVTVAGIQISGTPATVKSDGTTNTTITVTAVDASNATVPLTDITLSADTGLLANSTLKTDATGKATTTFSSGAASKANRTATITATAGTATALLPVQIVGSTLTLKATGTSLPANGTSPVTLTITAQDAGSFPISGAVVTLTQSGAGVLTFTPTTVTTGSNGIATVSIAGATAGTVTLTAAGVGFTQSIDFTVTATASTFGISLTTLNGGTGVIPTSPKNASMNIGGALAVQVTAPSPTANVIFATTIGVWNGTASQVVTVPSVAGIATASLSSAVAGVANVQVYDANPNNTTLKDTLAVGITGTTAASISLQATPTVVSPSVGSTQNYSTLTATVLDATGAPVGGVPVAFSIVAGTGTNSGETVSPVVVFTASNTQNGLALGAAPAQFISGSLPSTQGGVQVRASVVGTAIATQPLAIPNATNSSYDLAIHIGGTAGSVAFGIAAKITDLGGSSTIYQLPMSVLVADSNGSPAPLGTVVNLSVWPIAWSTGLPCAPDYADGSFTSGRGDTGNFGTFFNEDSNENLILDASPAEDGVRKYYYGGTVAATAGTLDGKITPANSYGGTVVSTNPADKPGTVTTDANGVAAFNLTYTKSSALFVISRIRAQTQVQGTPAVGQISMRLPASLADDSPTQCSLLASPFTF
jgi:hypothetical protein